MAFEEEFGSEISDSEAEKILTVGDAVKFIEGKAKNFHALRKDGVMIMPLFWGRQDYFCNLLSKRDI